MNLKAIYNQLNVFCQCKKYGLSLWQCPNFLFLIMGLFIITTTIISYALGIKYIADPTIVALLVLLMSAVLFIISFIIIKNFERLANENQIKSRFVSIISHQLRSPITSLKWTIDLLLSNIAGKVEKKQMEFLILLKENINQMAELISNLLIISQIEAGKMPPKKTFFFLGDIVKKLIDESRPFAASYNTELKFDIKDNLPKIFADAEQTKLVIKKLFDNAIKYIKPGGKIEIKIFKKNQNIYFEIKDEGIGIPKEEQRYVFQKFFRSENAKKIQTHGSGLDLYIAKNIIEKNGGKIGFQSEENKGSTFWFILPIK